MFQTVNIQFIFNDRGEAILLATGKWLNSEVPDKDKVQIKISFKAYHQE